MRIFDADAKRVANISTPGVFGVEHKGEVLEFNNGKNRTRTLKVPDSTTTEDVLKYINMVFESLDESVQDKVFYSYQRIHDMFETIMDPDMLAARLKTEVTELYKNFSFEYVKDTVTSRERILIPSNVTSTYEEMEISERSQIHKNYRVTTYLRKDYLDLVCLAIYMKPMIPIWAEYLRSLDLPGTKSKYREYKSMVLISGTDITELPTYHRFRDYIEANTEAISNQMQTRAPATTTAILGGLGTSELPDWLMAKTIIRKLILIGLSTSDSNSSVISILYKNIESDLKSLGRKFSGQVSFKKKPRDNELSDDKSLLEIYKMQQDQSDGDITITTMYGEKPIEVLLNKFNEKRNVDVPLDLTLECYNSTINIGAEAPTNAQFTLLGWIIHPLIHFFELDYQSRESIAKLQAIAMAYLIAHDFPEVALLINARPAIDETGHFLGGVSSKSFINRQNMTSFTEMFPYYHEKGAKESERQKNLGCVGTNIVCDELVQCDWIVNAPQRIQEGVNLVDQDGIISPPASLPNRIAEIILLLNA